MCQRSQCLDCGEVLLEARRLELGVRLAKVVAIKGSAAGHPAGKQPAAKGAIAEHDQAIIPSVGQHIGFDCALEQVVRRLHCGQGGGYAKCIHLLSGIVAYADRKNFAFLAQLFQFGRGLLNGDQWVWPMHLVQIDAVGA